MTRRKREADRPDDLTLFFDHINGEQDVLSILLRGHLYVEAGLVGFIRANLANPDALNVQRLRFQEKIDLAIALGAMGQEDRDALLKFNALRNRVAHRLDHQMSEDEITDIYDSLDEMMHILSGDGPMPNAPLIENLQNLIVTFVTAYHHPLSAKLLARPRKT